MQEHQDELDAIGVEVSVVTFEELEEARDYVRRNELRWQMLVDTERSMYKQFGMGSASLWQLLKPSSLWKYCVLWTKGSKSQKMGSDIHQLGGDVVIDPDGKLRLNYVSVEPHDRPEVDDLLAILRSEPES